MLVGAVFPHAAVEPTTQDVRHFARAVEDLGYTHLLAYDHVLGADPEHHAPWDRAYDISSSFHELFVLFGFLAATTSLELVSGVLVLPQRQTALVAKQAAQVELLAPGRLRLGVGVGWNHVEYEALGQQFGARGRRMEEQITLLRRLWSEPVVTFHGDHDTVTAAGIRPRPARTIPIWLGGRSAPAYRRIGRLADGWIPEMQPGPELDDARAVIAQSAAEAGRDVAAIGMHARLPWTEDADELRAGFERWRAEGATHLSVNTLRSGPTTMSEHLDALTDAAAVLGPAPEHG
ncbi:LLM class F420-dependent oxidoreductase [Actinomycetospora termitidis]|uniref:LLM class F420-dependent oxidoreductase n=1 Tax=Actinomycetospora termitidis TaxID=3053470 RepID=A0ABT7M6E2_9PSEU|nr:LLM class F420-dependent oxidoreductase [Actinomycetospora sp. Odt1-22]MDL5156229.1 LLM class F420-dependent oxidoreductase [Actinomycetospora sp. Odt1-22]